MEDLIKKKGARLSEHQLNEVKLSAGATLDKYPDMLTGQAFFYALHGMFPEVADEIRGTDLDPSYRVELLPDLYEFLLTEQKDEEKEGWQVCPVCNAYVFKDPCRVCSGAGIISIKTGKPPK